MLGWLSSFISTGLKDALFDWATGSNKTDDKSGGKPLIDVLKKWQDDQKAQFSPLKPQSPITSVPKIGERVSPFANVMGPPNIGGLQKSPIGVDAKTKADIHKILTTPSNIITTTRIKPLQPVTVPLSSDKNFVSIINDNFVKSADKMKEIVGEIERKNEEVRKLETNILSKTDTAFAKLADRNQQMAVDVSARVDQIAGRIRGIEEYVTTTDRNIERLQADVHNTQNLVETSSGGGRAYSSVFGQPGQGLTSTMISNLIGALGHVTTKGVGTAMLGGMAVTKGIRDLSGESQRDAGSTTELRKKWDREGYSWWEQFQAGGPWNSPQGRPWGERRLKKLEETYPGGKWGETVGGYESSENWLKDFLGAKTPYQPPGMSDPRRFIPESLKGAFEPYNPTTGSRSIIAAKPGRPGALSQAYESGIGDQHFINWITGPSPMFRTAPYGPASWSSSGGFGGGGGGSVGGGYGGGGGGYVAPPIPGSGNYTPSGQPVGMTGPNRVDSTSLYNTLKDKFAASKLNGYVPPDGAKFGIIKGTPEEWARFGVAVARQESGFSTRSTNLGDPGGSFGLFQFAHGQVPGGNAYDPNASIDAFVRDTERWSYGKDGTGSIGGMGARFGSIRRPWETTQHLPWVDQNVVNQQTQQPQGPRSITEQNAERTRAQGAMTWEGGSTKPSRRFDTPGLPGQGQTYQGSQIWPQLGERGAHGYARGNIGVAPWLIEATRFASKALPEGYRAEVISTVDARARTPWHPTGRAIDIQIYGPDGRPIRNVGLREGTMEYALYERAALAAKQYQMKYYPNEKFVWGGHFNSGVPYDLMHFQSTGTSARNFTKEQLGSPIIPADKMEEFYKMYNGQIPMGPGAMAPPGVMPQGGVNSEPMDYTYITPQMYKETGQRMVLGSTILGAAGFVAGNILAPGVGGAAGMTGGILAGSALGAHNLTDEHVKEWWIKHRMGKEGKWSEGKNDPASEYARLGLYQGGGPDDPRPNLKRSAPLVPPEPKPTMMPPGIPRHGRSYNPYERAPSTNEKNDPLSRTVVPPPPELDKRSDYNPYVAEPGTIGDVKPGGWYQKGGSYYPMPGYRAYDPNAKFGFGQRMGKVLGPYPGAPKPAISEPVKPQTPLDRLLGASGGVYPGGGITSTRPVEPKPKPPPRAGSEKNPIQMKRKDFEAGQEAEALKAARGGAYAGGGIPGRTPGPNYEQARKEEELESQIKSPIATHGADNNPPAPGDAGTGSPMNQVCFV